MKKRIFTVIISAFLLFTLCSCAKQAQNQKDPAETEQNNPTAYTSAQQITDAFMQVCRDKDVQKMYDMYYNDMLDKTYERIKDNITRENFDLLLSEEMESIESYELYEYGKCEEVAASVSPLYYVDYINYSATGEETGIPEESVTSCAVLRVFKNDGGQSDHMLAEIDGAWYVTQ